MRRDKSVRGCDERETKCTGTTDEPHLIVERMRRRNMKTGGHERKEETEVREGERMKGGSKWRGREPMKPTSLEAPRGLASFDVCAVCAPESGTGSNEPQKMLWSLWPR